MSAQALHDSMVLRARLDVVDPHTLRGVHRVTKAWYTLIVQKDKTQPTKLIAGERDVSVDGHQLVQVSALLVGATHNRIYSYL